MLTTELMLMMLPPVGQDVGVELAVELFFRDFFQWGELVDARVIHQHVEFAEGLFDLADQALHVFLLGHVALDGHSLAAIRGDFRHHALGV